MFDYFHDCGQKNAMHRNAFRNHSTNDNPELMSTLPPMDFPISWKSSSSPNGLQKQSVIWGGNKNH